MAEYRLTTPVSKDTVASLKAGDTVFITGTLLTARDKAHVRMMEYFNAGKPLPFDLEGAVIFHGAPIVKKEGDEWKIVAVGPTTSARMESMAPAVIKKSGVRLIIGKGGMGKDTLNALQDAGAAYLSMTGGIAVTGARMVKKVRGPVWEDLGLAEAVWSLDVEDFGPLTVTMDAHMGDLHEKVRKRVLENVKKIT